MFEASQQYRDRVSGASLETFFLKLTHLGGGGPIAVLQALGGIQVTNELTRKLPLAVTLA